MYPMVLIPCPSGEWTPSSSPAKRKTKIVFVEHNATAGRSLNCVPSPRNEWPHIAYFLETAEGNGWNLKPKKAQGGRANSLLNPPQQLHVEAHILFSG